MASNQLLKSSSRLNDRPHNHITFLEFTCSQSGRAALHVSAERGHLEVAQELLEHKAYVNAKSKVNIKLRLIRRVRRFRRERIS